MEGRAEAELDACKLEQITPHVAGEHGVPVADDIVREPVQANDGFEECLGNRGGGVGMAQRDEVGILREAIHHGQDDTLAMDAVRPSMKSREILDDTCEGTFRGCNKPTG